MFWLIYGKGWIGTKIRDNISISYPQDEIRIGMARCDDPAAVSAELNLFCSQSHQLRVICCIGRTHGGDVPNIDYLEDNLQENLRDNLFAPFVLAKQCHDRNIHLTYIGSGCIFAGDEHFSEEHGANFFGSDYSIVKGFTDKIMGQYNNVLNARIRMPIGYENDKRNLLMKLINFDVIHSAPNSITVLDDIIPLIVELAAADKTGTWNMTNPGAITHNEILEMYREIVNPNFKWKNGSAAELMLKCERTNVVLNTEKLQSRFPNVPTAADSVRKIMNRVAFQRDELLWVLNSSGISFGGWFLD